jgi:simple sugar transport system permease protein
MSPKSKSIHLKNNLNQDDRLKKVSSLRVLLNRPELGALGGAILVFIFFGIGLILAIDYYERRKK